MVATNLGKSENAINMKGMEHPAVKGFMSTISPDTKMGQPELPADAMVALAVDDRCKVLSGKHVDADRDIEAVVVEAEKEGGGKIGREKLYVVNIGAL